MLTRLGRRTGGAVVLVAALAAAVTLSSTIPVTRAPNGTFAISTAADYYGGDGYSSTDETIFEAFGVGICAGYGFAASLAFGPLGAAGFGVSCAFTMFA